MRSLVWLAAAAAACGSVNKLKPDAQVIDAAVDAPPDPQNGAKSGTRIKLQWYVFEDGTKQPSGAFHDTQLGADCYQGNFYGDTHRYCMPNYTQVYYSDASCTQGVAVVYQSSCAAQQYTYQFAGETQSMNCMYGLTHLYHLGATTAVANLYYKSGATCQNGGAPSTNQAVYALGAEVTSSALAEMTMSTPGPGALGVISLQTADGLNFPYQLHDSTGGFDCQPEYNYYGATSAPCFPTHTGYSGYYSDATCATNTTQVQMGCSAPPYLYKPTKNQCTLDPYEIHQTGSQVAPTPTMFYVWNASAQTCNANTPSTGATFYNLGAAITMQTLMRTHEAIPGHRMQGIQMTAGDTRMRDYLLYDSTLDAECYMQQMADGSYRCLQTSAYIDTSTTLYSDAACSMQINLAQQYKGGSASCASPPAPGYAYESVMVGQCYGYNMFTTGAKYTGTVYYLNGTCQVYPQTQYDWYVVGPQVPVVGLAAATLQNDP